LFAGVEDVVQNLKHKEEVPRMADILQLSNGGDAYHWICAKMLKCVVGYATWNRRCYKELLSDFATASDESFLVVTIENNYQRWLDEAKHRYTNGEEDQEDVTWRAKLAPAKFTNSGSSSANGNGSNRRCGGWSKPGYLRFNSIYSQVQEDRKRRANFELGLKEHFQAEKNMDEDDEDSDSNDEEIVPANDIIGAKQPTTTRQDELDDNEDVVVAV
jgi:hypothetical protein